MQSIFGDDVPVGDPTKAQVIGARVPSQGVYPVQATLGTREPVTRTLTRTKSMTIPREIPGTWVDRNPVRAPLVSHRGVTTPISAVAPRNLPIGPQLDPRLSQAPEESFDARMLDRRSGVFHTPPMVGRDRYTEAHQFGPPTLGGLSALSNAVFQGLAGLIGYK